MRCLLAVVLVLAMPRTHACCSAPGPRRSVKTPLYPCLAAILVLLMATIWLGRLKRLRIKVEGGVVQKDE